MLGPNLQGTTERQYRVLPADVLAARLDMRREVMETLLSYLEVRWTSVLSCSAVACFSGCMPGPRRAHNGLHLSTV